MGRNRLDNFLVTKFVATREAFYLSTKSHCQPVNVQHDVQYRFANIRVDVCHTFAELVNVGGQ